jgi:flagellar biosynthesis protein FlhF
MQIKRFEASDMQQAVRQVKEALGPEAIILSTKTLSTGGRRAGVEVVAALDRATADTPPDAERRQEGDGSLPERLMASGLAPEFVRTLVREMPPVRRGDDEAWESCKGYLQWKLMELVDVTGPITGGLNIWVFIGPTGVGKTTTLAKLAAQYRLKARKKVALISIDTYRIGAVEQLKTYASILGVPFELAFRPEDLRKIIENNRHQDLLLVDTVGRSPKDSAHMEVLRDFLSVDPAVENHLVLSATTKGRDLDRAVRQYGGMPIKSYVFTKLDETDEYAPLLNQLLRDRKPLSYLTTGQRVPEDIELATKMNVAELFIKNLWS